VFDVRPGTGDGGIRHWQEEHMAEFPSYRRLRERTDAPPGSAWGVFGPDDELGTLNHLTEQRTLAATRLPRTGQVVNLDLPLNAFDPALIPSRHPLSHHLFAGNPYHRDEYIDGFYPQAGSQIDGLRHIGHPDAGFYGGADPDRFTEGEPLLGVQRFAEHGIVGRGVLVDVERYLRDEGMPIDQDVDTAVPVDVVARAAKAQGTVLLPGDILMIRFGWVRHHLHSRDDAARTEAVQAIRCPGLAANHETAEWLWDNQFAVVAADNFALEAWPAASDSPLIADAERDGRVAPTRHTGLLHRVVIPLLGMVIGELWDLDALADACAADGVYECLLVAKPLMLVGGAGSPANAVAIR
jgi:kynurenine formamidase